MKPLKYCYNGDGHPVCPPSKVLCRECLDKVSLDIENMIDDLKKQEATNDPST